MGRREGSFAGIREEFLCCVQVEQSGMQGTCLELGVCDRELADSLLGM